MKIAVAVLNWNGVSWLKKFMPTLMEYSPQAEVWVVDNGSTDASVNWLNDTFGGKVRLLLLNENFGYAGGYNHAMEEIDADWIVCLNSDVEVSPNWLCAPLELIQSSPLCGALQPKVKDYNKRDFFEYAGAAGGFIDRLGYPFCNGRIFNLCEKDEGQYDGKAYPIFWASGAVLFLKKEAWKSAGGFDTDFFAHMEEIDLCWRIKLEQYEILYCPDSEVFHVGGGTLAQGSTQKIFLNFRNSLFMLLKNSRAPHVFLKIFLRMLLDGVAALKFLTEPNGIGKFSAVFKAHLSFYRYSFIMWKKRKPITPDTPKPWYKGSIVLDFFVRKRKPDLFLNSK
jgi:GT2 family glycosyltransferase